MDNPKKMEYLTSMDTLMPLFKERLAAGQSICFSPRGISMLPMFRQGIDSMVLSPLPDKLKHIGVYPLSSLLMRYVVI